MGRDQRRPTLGRETTILNFAFATLLVGGLAVGLFWIAYVGLGLGFVGLLIRGIGFAAASSRHKLAVQLFSVGVALSLLGIGLGGYWSFTPSLAKSDVAMADSAWQRTAPRPRRTGSSRKRAKPRKSLGSLSGSTPNAPKSGDASKHDRGRRDQNTRPDARPVADPSNSPRSPSATKTVGRPVDGVVRAAERLPPRTRIR